MTDLYRIVDWARKNGDEKVIQRMRVFALGDLVKEQIKLEDVSTSSNCSAGCLTAIRKAAETVTKQKCPF